MYGSEQPVIISLDGVNRFYFITETDWVYYAIRAEYLTVSEVDLST